MSWSFELPDPPPWMKRHDGLRQVYLQRAHVQAEGRLVWARVYMANMGLWTPNAVHAAPAGVVYSFDAYLRERPEALAGIADAVYSLHDQEGKRPKPVLEREIPELLASMRGPTPEPAGNVWLRDLQDDVLTGFRRVFHRRLPPEITGTWCVYHSDVLLFSAFLPGGCLQDAALPILVGPSGTPLALPHDQWPER